MNATEVRIEVSDTVKDAIIKLSEGNPGAVSVLIGLIKRDEMQGFMDILTLDTLHLYGSDIWLAYKDVCGEDIEVLSQRLSEMDRTLVERVAKARDVR